MPSANVTWPNPLVRQNAFETGQMGVPGTWAETGLRQHSTGVIIWVDPNCPWAEDQQDGTDPGHPMVTIAAALTKCQPYRGDIVAVMANGFWTHAPKGAANYPLPIVENAVVTVHGVRIVGVFPSSALGVPWRAAVAGEPILTISAIDVLVEGFLFMGAPADGGANCNGIYSAWAGGATGLWGDNLTVRHCFFDGAIQTAINLEYVYNGDIHHNTFQECDIAGIYSDGDDPIRDCHFHHNWFHRVGEGGAADTGAISVVNATNCKINHNQIYNAAAQNSAAAVDEGINTSGAGGYNIVHENVLSCDLGAGVGQYGTFCNSAGTDAWIQNYCMDGVTTGNP